MGGRLMPLFSQSFGLSLFAIAFDASCRTFLINLHSYRSEVKIFVNSWLFFSIAGFDFELLDTFFKVEDTSQHLSLVEDSRSAAKCSSGGKSVLLSWDSWLLFSTPKCKWDNCLLCCFSPSRGLNLTFPLFTALTFSQAWSIHTILYRYRLTGLSNWILFSFRQLLYCARPEAGKFHTPDFLREWMNLVTSDFFSFRHNGRLASTRSFSTLCANALFSNNSTFRFRAGKSIQLKLEDSRRLTRDDSGV